MESKDKDESEVSEVMTGISRDHLQLRKRGSAADYGAHDVLDTKLGQDSVDKSHKCLKSKSLEDIERFTLCSNRII